MDLIALAFYAAVCGMLSVLAPSLGGRVQRLGIGAVVGLVAASMLPLIRSLLG